MEPGAEHQQQLRSLRDFLRVYNRMTELCFRHCVCDLGHRLLTGREESCLDSCARRLLRSSHRLAAAYVALVPAVAQRRASEREASAAQDPDRGAPAAAPGPGAAPRAAPGT